MQGIKALKLYAWERAFQMRVEKLRNKELFYVRCSALLESGNSVLFWGVSRSHPQDTLHPHLKSQEPFVAPPRPDIGSHRMPHNSCMMQRRFNSCNVAALQRQDR